MAADILYVFNCVFLTADVILLLLIIIGDKLDIADGVVAITISIVFSLILTLFPDAIKVLGLLHFPSPIVPLVLITVFFILLVFYMRKKRPRMRFYITLITGGSMVAAFIVFSVIKVCEISNVSGIVCPATSEPTEEALNPTLPPIPGPMEEPITQVPTTSALPPTVIVVVPSITATILPTESLTPAETGTATEMATATETPQAIVSVITEENANLRLGPGPRYRVLLSIPRNKQLTAQGKSVPVGEFDQRWYQVVHEENETTTVGWIWGGNVTWISGDEDLLTELTDYAAYPPGIETEPVIAQVCNPGQWNATCGSNSCGAEYVSQCNSAGTGYTCVWNPAQCSVQAPPIFSPPRPPAGSTAEPCNQTWIDGQIAHFAAQQGKSPGEFEAELVAGGYDTNGNGGIDCGDLS